MTDTVCYFIQTHRDPEQIYRLVRTLRRGSSKGPGRHPAQPDRVRARLVAARGLAGVYLMPPCGPQLRSHYSCRCSLSSISSTGWSGRG